MLAGAAVLAGGGAGSGTVLLLRFVLLYLAHRSLHALLHERRT